MISELLPGVYDALTAKIAEDVGFETAFQTGYVLERLF